MASQCQLKNCLERMEIRTVKFEGLGRAVLVIVLIAQSHEAKQEHYDIGSLP